MYSPVVLLFYVGICFFSPAYIQLFDESPDVELSSRISSAASLTYTNLQKELRSLAKLEELNPLVKAWHACHLC